MPGPLSVNDPNRGGVMGGRRVPPAQGGPANPYRQQQMQPGVTSPDIGFLDQFNRLGRPAPNPAGGPVGAGQAPAFPFGGAPTGNPFMGGGPPPGGMPARPAPPAPKKRAAPAKGKAKAAPKAKASASKPRPKAKAAPKGRRY